MTEGQYHQQNLKLHPQFHATVKYATLLDDCDDGEIVCVVRVHTATGIDIQVFKDIKISLMNDVWSVVIP